MQTTRVKAPELIGGVSWLNVNGPITLDDLKGKVVLLDFWTFCCVDCLHILPYLKQLEARFPDQLVVIGVHSGKFDNEKGDQNIKHAIGRYGIEHPVINDARFKLWESFWVREWPTLILIDPEGFVVKRIPCSEKPYGKFDSEIADLVQEFEGKLNLKPLPQMVGVRRDAGQFLCFPGKVTADANRLCISDTGHNRILICDLAGNVTTVIGSGQAGSVDGAFSACQFNQPQGLVLSGDTLYIADTENHLLRAADLKTSVVKTIAGTGKQALLADGLPAESLPALKTALSSPWDLTVVGNRLFIAMAGSHQIWVYDILTAAIEVHAGTGHESLLDGPAGKANLAQTSGLTSDGKTIFFADSETSSIRSVGVQKNSSVTTLVGEGLFEFGDRDGIGKEARLQHPLAVAFVDGKLYVCDSYNHKIKVVDPTDRSVKTVAGDGVFSEPGGLTALKDKLFIADTNNHSIRVLDLGSSSVSTLKLTGPAAAADLGLEPIDLGANAALPNLKTMALEPITFAAGVECLIEVNIDFPPEMHLNSEAPLICDLSGPGRIKVPSRIVENPPKLPLKVKVQTPPGKVVEGLTMTIQVIYCSTGVVDESAACHIANLRLEQPISVQPGAKDKIAAVSVALR
jgi:thiol-disulfide isomerase/thioredoxin